MERMDDESNHNLSEFWALGSINFKVGGKEVLKLLNALGWPDFEIKEIFSEWLKDLERYYNLYTYERIITPIRQDDDNAEDNPTEDQIWKMETLKRMSESIIKRPRLMASRLKINVDKIYDINRKIKRHLKMENRFPSRIKDLRIKEKAEILEIIKDFWLSNCHNFYTATDVRDHISKQIPFNEYPSLSTVRAWMKDELGMSF